MGSAVIVGLAAPNEDDDAGVQLPATMDIGVNFGNGHYFDGIVDEVRAWSIARTATQIQATMRTRLVGNEPSLVGYWRLTEGASTDRPPPTARRDAPAMAYFGNDDAAADRNVGTIDRLHGDFMRILLALAASLLLFLAARRSRSRRKRPPAAKRSAIAASFLPGKSRHVRRRADDCHEANCFVCQSQH